MQTHLCLPGDTKYTDASSVKTTFSHSLSLFSLQNSVCFSDTSLATWGPFHLKPLSTKNLETEIISSQIYSVVYYPFGMLRRIKINHYLISLVEMIFTRIFDFLFSIFAQRMLFDIMDSLVSLFLVCFLLNFLCFGHLLFFTKNLDLQIYLCSLLALDPLILLA